MADGPLAAVNATTTPTTTSTTAQRLKKKNLCWTPWPCDPWTSTTAAADGERAVNPAAMEPDMPRPVEKEAGSLMPVLEPRKGGGGHGGSFSSSSSSGGRGGSSSSSGGYHHGGYHYGGYHNVAAAGGVAGLRMEAVVLGTGAAIFLGRMM